jgi:hypothetical protein
MAEVPDQTTANSETMKQNDDGLSASSKDVARDQWSSVVRTQTRFNEIIHRTRQLTMTAVAAAFGAAFASFATKSANLTIEAFQLTVPSATLLVRADVRHAHSSSGQGNALRQLVLSVRSTAPPMMPPRRSAVTCSCRKRG